MKYNALKKAMGLGLVSMVFLSYNIPVMANAGMKDVLSNGTVNMSFSQNTQSVQSIKEVVKRESSSMEDIENTIDLRTLLEEHIEQMDTELWHLVIAQVEDYVNVRSMPSEDGEVVGKLYNNSVGEYVAEENGWYKITSGNVTGYVKAEYCVIGLKAAEVAKDFTEFVTAESREEEEARLAAEERRRAEVREAARLAAEEEAKAKAAAEAENAAVIVTESSEIGTEIANYACQFVGNPYKWGGTSLTDGADCSGFVMSVYANFGVELPHSSAADREVGYAVESLSEAIPGDIICYSGHVAIYIGDGQIVHASSAKTGIIISNADYKKIVCIRRVF